VNNELEVMYEEAVIT